MAAIGIGGVPAVTAGTDLGALTAGRTLGVDRAAASRGADFAGLVADGLSTLEALDRTAQGAAVRAATGDLTDIHDYVIAATQAQVAAELTTTVRNKALEAFNEIMRMPL